MAADEQFDGYFREILQRGRGIENLFVALFSFLRRSSDYFEQPGEGFSVIEKCFKAEQAKFDEKKRKEKEKAEKEKARKEAQEKEKEKEKNKSAEVREITKEEFERRKREEDEKIKNAGKVEETKTEVATTSTTTETTEDKGKEKEEDTEERDRKAKITQMDETLRTELLKKTAHLDDKNGGRSRNYTWVQHQVEQFEMFIPIDSSVRGSDIKVDFDSKHLKVQVKGEYLVNGELFAPINADTLFWNVDDAKIGKVISITWEKIYRMAWWDYVIKGDDVLALKKFNPDPSKLSDLDPSMRPEIEKMMIENSYKMQGKPFHKDPKTNDLMQDFMKKHPEMDFSKAKMN